MISKILVYNHDKAIDETILGFLASICHPTKLPFSKYDDAKFMAEIIHLQLINYNSLKTFRYYSYLVYLIIARLIFK